MYKGTPILLLCMSAGSMLYGQETDTIHTQIPAHISESELSDSTAFGLDEIIVTGLNGQRRVSKVPLAISSVDREYLNSSQHSNIIDALDRLPGVSQITTGAGISKPVIRGLGYNRVLVVSDGVRQEGQQWGDEHGVEIDGNSVGKAEIIKGPASLVYGSDAMAGVVRLDDDPPAREGEIKGNLNMQYQSNNGLFNYSADCAGNLRGFFWDARYSDNLAHDYRNRINGYVPNSRFRQNAATAMAGVMGNWGRTLLRFNYYHLEPGIIDAHADVEGDHHHHHPGPTLEGGRDYKAEVPMQKVDHYKLVSSTNASVGRGTLTANIGFQQNRRREFEHSAYESSLDFLLRSYTADLRYSIRPAGLFSLDCGASGMIQSSDNLGEEFLIPAYRSYDIGVFATADKDLGESVTLAGGVRFDTRSLHGLPLEEDGVARFEEIRRTFTGISASLGATWHCLSGLDLKFNLSRGYRAPNMSELGSNGCHEGTYRYETGDAALDAEQSIQADLGAGFRSRFVDAEAALFINRVDGYIYLRREGSEVIDGIPVYRYHSTDALLAGGEASVTVRSHDLVSLENTFSYVNSRRLHSHGENQWLPMTPAPELNTTLRVGLCRESRIFESPYVSVGMNLAFRQNHVCTIDDTETPTPSYTLFSLSAGTGVRIHGKQRFAVYLNISNIFDRAYVSHLSRLKYVTLESPAGHTPVYNMGRNIGVRIVVPFSNM